VQSIFQLQILFTLCFQCNYHFFNKLRISPNQEQSSHSKLATLIRIPSAIADIFSSEIRGNSSLDYGS